VEAFSQYALALPRNTLFGIIAESRSRSLGFPTNISRGADSNSTPFGFRCFRLQGSTRAARQPSVGPYTSWSRTEVD
jgi:hypothetical protein